MVYRPDIDERLCFVLMPFQPPFNDHYQKIIKPAAADAELEALRADDIFGTVVIISDIGIRSGARAWSSLMLPTKTRT